MDYRLDYSNMLILEVNHYQNNLLVTLIYIEQLGMNPTGSGLEKSSIMRPRIDFSTTFLFG